VKPFFLACALLLALAFIVCGFIGWHQLDNAPADVKLLAATVWFAWAALLAILLASVDMERT
jgi:4-hydroxybenzoate polyprenyltransferase